MFYDKISDTLSIYVILTVILKKQVGCMENNWGEVIEETAPGADNMDLMWMIPFWASFTQCVIELNADHIITNVRRKQDSNSSLPNLTDTSFIDFAVEKDKELVKKKLDDLKNAVVPHLRFQFLSKIGRYYRWTLIPFYKNEVYAGCHGVAVDVTENTKSNITLNWQHAVLEAGRDFVHIFDMEGRELYSNPGVYKMTGYPLNTKKIPLEIIFTPDHYMAVYGEGIDAATKHGFWSGRGELIRADGDLVPIEHTMFSIKDEHGNVILIANIIRDITQFLEHEREIEEARKAAEAANIAKSDFLSRMSHEIRTPMNAIIGMIKIGLGTDNTDRKNYCLTRADNAAKHLLSIINDVLDMSKIEAEKFELSYDEFNFEKSLKNIASMANIRAEDKHLIFIVNLDSDVPVYISCDEMRLSQVITNLLTNAIKFTPEKGIVSLNISKHEEIDDEVILKIEVADTGIGISKEQQEKLFVPFNQANSGIASTFGGTGLGLAISKRIVELMGGTIWIESELGKGAKFIFTLKLEKVKKQYHTEIHESTALNNMRVLAVDESAQIRDYFRNTLNAYRLDCDVASSGAEAIDMIKASGYTGYSIFFIDRQLPDMEGVELARAIRQHNARSSIVLMISANDWTSVEQQAVTIGIDHFISKPLFPSTLLNSVNFCMGEEIFEIVEDEADDIHKLYDFRKHTIMIAEDVEINREIMSAILEITGVCIEFAENGKIALSMFLQNPEKYALILMDINMPEMDGYEATRQIRASDAKRAKEIPIIAMTANVFKEDFDRCLAAGMNNHTGKPIDIDELLEKMSRYMESD